MDWKPNLRNQSIGRIIIVIALFLGAMKIPFHLILEKFFVEEDAYYIKKILFSCIIISYSVFLIRKYQFQFFSGLVNPTINYFYLYAILFYFRFLAPSPNFKDLSFSDILIPFIGIMLHAFAEELTFRGIILPTLIRNNASSINRIRRSVFVSALIFGGVHIISIFKYDIVSTLGQVMYASVFGLFCSVLLLKGNNIYLLGFIHGIFNFLSKVNSIGRNSLKVNDVNTDFENSGLLSLALIFILLAPLLGISIYLIKKITMKDISRLRAAA